MAGARGVELAACGRSAACGACGGGSSGGEVEFVLGVGSGVGDRWRSGGEADAVEVGADGDRVGEGGDDLHRAAALGAHGDVQLEGTGFILHLPQWSCPLGWG